MVVATGALGAHALKPYLTPETADTFRTGVLYQLFHTIAMLAISLSGKQALQRANKFFLAGIILFSFSLYFYSITGIKFAAMITPFGGVSFLAGWISLIVSAMKSGKNAQ